MPLPTAGTGRPADDLALDFGGKLFELQFQRDVIALQALTGTDRISVAMVPDLSDPTPEGAVSVLAHAGRLVKEAGEGTSALLAASEGGCRHEARAELLDIVAAAQAALVALDAPSALRATPFERVDRGIAPNSTMMTVAVDPRAPDHVFCNSRDGQVFGSLDDGATWTTFQLPDKAKEVRALAAG